MKNKRKRALAMARALSTYRKGLADIAYARSLHRAMLRNLSECTSLVSIHEQPQGATMPIREELGMFSRKREWPWAVSQSCPCAEVAGCEVGLTNPQGKLMSKKWQFQVRGSAVLLSVLRSLSCSHNEKHERAEGDSTRQTETYPRQLANIIVLGGLR